MNNQQRLPKQLILKILPLLLLLGSCRSPSIKFDHTAKDLGLVREVVTGNAFQHVLFWKNRGQSLTLHVYLGGDGVPKIDGKPANDPTPRNPLTLRLLAQDPNTSVYLGRPCYHGFAKDSECSSALWTTARYSKRVVASMVAVIKKILQKYGHNKILLFGHSGGGTLAMLLAERLPETVAVVTIAANLDIKTWTNLLGYSTLVESLNPVARPTLRNNVRQFHYIGGHDHIVPPQVTAHAAKILQSEPIIIKEFDHICCWEAIWGGILEKVSAPE